MLLLCQKQCNANWFCLQPGLAAQCLTPGSLVQSSPFMHPWAVQLHCHPEGCSQPTGCSALQHLTAVPHTQAHTANDIAASPQASSAARGSRAACTITYKTAASRQVQAASASDLVCLPLKKLCHDNAAVPHCASQHSISKRCIASAFAAGGRVLAPVASCHLWRQSLQPQILPGGWSALCSRLNSAPASCAYRACGSAPCRETCHFTCRMHHAHYNGPPSWRQDCTK